MSPSNMVRNLTVGEVARRSGLTVRTLHHYDAIGLVRPSHRSAAGYRLYTARDIERLHAVQSLKQLGLGLEAIEATLAGRGVPPRDLLERQVREAERAVREAHALRENLLLLRDTIGRGDATTDHLLEGMRLLTVYRQHLPGHSVRQLLARWRRARPRWQPIAAALASCRTEGMPAEAPEVQRLAQRWMNVAMDVFGGRMDTVLQWARMHGEAPNTAVHAGLDPTLLGYLEEAIGARIAALRRHLTAEDLARLDGTLGLAWEQLAADGQALLDARTPSDTETARAFRQRYRELLARTVGHDDALAEKMRRAYVAEPILAHGHYLTSELRAYLESIST